MGFATNSGTPGRPQSPSQPDPSPKASILKPKPETLSPNLARISEIWFLLGVRA